MKAGLRARLSFARRWSSRTAEATLDAVRSLSQAKLRHSGSFLAYLHVTRQGPRSLAKDCRSHAAADSRTRTSPHPDRLWTIAERSNRTAYTRREAMPRHFNWMVSLLLIAALVLAGCSEEATAPEPREGPDATAEGQRYAFGFGGSAVVANRGSGSISVVDARTNTVSGTYMLPAATGEPTPEPMYVVYTHQGDRVFVGDRANDRVAVFNARTYDVEGTIPAGDGVFHMWADRRGRQLWVNNDIDNTVTVIDPQSLEVIATVPIPADLVAMGGKPHDVILGPRGMNAYVTVLGVSGPSDYVVQFRTHDFEEVARAEVGKDPHVSLAWNRRWLFVPCQNSDQVVVLNRFGLHREAVLSIPGAHGAGMARNGRFFYTTNLTGGGADALFTINTRTLEVVGGAVDAPYAVPHNIALTSNSRKLFVTHSGATSDKVTIYKRRGFSPVPEYSDEVTVGLNPFGITFVP
ncbi:MAG: beta-propeller fold lactonase family protein [Candidatus Eisenbacteria bacterium]|nr:beta-propeller fold lactonase family protein [Candidatus Eisenbacteria bacterium]